MKHKIFRQFLANYLAILVLSLLAAAFAFLLLSLADGALAKTLMKNVYTTGSLMQDDYRAIDSEGVAANGGGVQIIDGSHQVVYSRGLDLIGQSRLSTGEFTDFLTQSKAKGLPYHIDVLYNDRADFWLVVTFPTSIRLDFSLVYNRQAPSADMENVAKIFGAVALFYFLLLAVFALVFSRLTSSGITGPLQKLCEGAKRLREGDYSTRVNLQLKNEFKELQDTFNEMAAKIENETALRKQAEEDRKRMILDISHDLKNPLASITGYSELCLKKAGQGAEEEIKGYLEIIGKHSRRASRLLSQFFALSCLESPLFTLELHKTDICEYLRQICSELLPSMEQAGFGYDFDIPEGPVYAMIDAGQMSRVFHNLADNALAYNAPGTRISVKLSRAAGRILIYFQDDGIGIPHTLAADIFKPFVRADAARNSETGGSGLGLAIAHRIMEAQAGTLELRTGSNQGCTFIITLPED